MISDIDAWFAELDRFIDVPFMEDGRRQPLMSEEEDLARELPSLPTPRQPTADWMAKA
jgi:hypothetical protein